MLFFKEISELFDKDAEFSSCGVKEGPKLVD